MAFLVIRKLADKSTGERVTKYDPDTGEKRLVNPATPGDEHEPWPLAGIELEKAPDECNVPTSTVDTGVAEGWITRINERPAVRPAGATMGRWNSGHTGTPHVFMHADELVFHTVSGDVRYQVTHQPDKYAAEGDADTPVTPDAYAAGETRVDWFYGLVKVA